MGQRTAVVDDEAEQVLHRVADRVPFGLFTLAEAAAAGIDRFAVGRLVREGVLAREAPGLHRIAGVPPHPRLRLAVPQRYLEGVARYRSGDGKLHGALTDLDALELLGCPMDIACGSFPLPEELVLGRPTIAMGRDRDARLKWPPFEVVHHDLDRLGISRREDLHTVDAAAAIADVFGRSNAPRQHLGVVDAARNRLGLDTVGLVDRWEEMGTLGALRLLHLEAEGLLEQESGGERRAFQLLFEGQSYVPDCQVVVLGKLRADFAHVRARVVIEFLGKAAHEGRWADDIGRVHLLQSAGWLVILITAAMLRQHRRVAADIQRTIADRLDLAARGPLTGSPLPPQPRRRRPLATL